MKIEADQTFFQTGLDRAAVIVGKGPAFA